MGSKMKSFASVVALAFVVLFFGPAVSKANGQYASFDGQFPLPHGSLNVNVSDGGFYRHHGFYRSYQPYFRYSRPYYRSSFYHYRRPYRLVRVFLYAPFPHWGYRRVYYASPAYGAYCPY